MTCELIRIVWIDKDRFYYPVCNKFEKLQRIFKTVFEIKNSEYTLITFIVGFGSMTVLFFKN